MVLQRRGLKEGVGNESVLVCEAGFGVNSECTSETDLRCDALGSCLRATRTLVGDCRYQASQQKQFGAYLKGERIVLMSVVIMRYDRVYWILTVRSPDEIDPSLKAISHSSKSKTM